MEQVLRFLLMNRRLAVAAGVFIILLGLISYYGLLRKNTSSVVPSFVPAYILPYAVGVDRVHMTKAQLEVRVQKFVESRQFFILKNKPMIDGIPEILKYRKIIEAAATGHFDADTVEAILWLESQGRTSVQSPTGPVGIAQMTKATAVALGLVVHYEPLYNLKKMKKGRRVVVQKVLAGYKCVRDDRLDPAKAIPAAVRLLEDEYKFFGQSDFAVAVYHMGRPRMIELVKMYLSPQPTFTGGAADIQKYGISYADVFFRNTPYENAGTYALIQKLMDVDFSPTYFFRVQCAKSLLALYRKDVQGFKDLVAAQKINMDDPKYRMWTFYRPGEEFVHLDDLRKGLQSGALVSVPDKPEEYFYKLRLDGTDCVAQLDLEHQQFYCSTKPETYGCLRVVAGELRRLGVQWQPELTALVRTKDYQKKLAKIGKPVTFGLETHSLGYAFDIAKSGLSDEQRRDLEFILEELDSVGMIGWIPEKAAYHVVVAPDEKALDLLRAIRNMLLA